MSALDGFMSVWSAARKTFGEGTPQGGDRLGNSAQLDRLQDSLQAAAPGSEWSGAGSDTYADANARHSRRVGALTGLDRRLGVEIDRSAAVVAAGRRDLDSVKLWVQDAASRVPPTTTGERTLWPVVSKGANDIADILRRSHSDLAAIAGRIRTLGGGYRDLDQQRTDADAEPVDFQSGGDDGAIPDTTLDLEDIEYLAPGVRGRPGMMELVPGSGVWVPNPRSRFYSPSPVKAPLDFNDIEYLGPGVKGRPWQMELVPGSGAWVPNPNHPGYQPKVPEAPIDLGKIEIVDPGPLIPSDMVELWPHAGILIPDPYLGRPF